MLGFLLHSMILSLELRLKGRQSFLCEQFDQFYNRCNDVLQGLILDIKTREGARRNKLGFLLHSMILSLELRLKGRQLFLCEQFDQFYNRCNNVIQGLILDSKTRVGARINKLGFLLHSMIISLELRLKGRQLFLCEQFDQFYN
jgi:hypothetical protein